MRLGVCEVEAGHAGGGQHGEAGGEADPGAGLHVQQPPHGHLATGDGQWSCDVVIIVFTGHLLGVVGLHGVAGGGADTRVPHAVQVLATQTLRTENLRKNI